MLLPSFVRGGLVAWADQQRLLLNTERKGQKSCLVFLGPRGNSSQQIVFRRAGEQAGQDSGGDAHADRSEAGMGTRLSSQPLPLSPSAVTLNNTLSLITATITLRNKLVFSRGGTGTAKRRPPYACGLPFSLLLLNLFGDRRAEDQFGAQFSALYNSFSLFLSFLSLRTSRCSSWPFSPKPFDHLETFA